MYTNHPPGDSNVNSGGINIHRHINPTCDHTEDTYECVDTEGGVFTIVTKERGGRIYDSD